MCHPGCVIKSAFDKIEKKEEEEDEKRGGNIHCGDSLCVGAVLGSQVQQPTPPPQPPAAIYCFVVANKQKKNIYEKKRQERSTKRAMSSVFLLKV